MCQSFLICVFDISLKKKIITCFVFGHPCVMLNTVFNLLEDFFKIFLSLGCCIIDVKDISIFMYVQYRLMQVN